MGSDNQMTDLQHFVPFLFASDGTYGLMVIVGCLGGFWLLSALPRFFRRHRTGTSRSPSPRPPAQILQWTPPAPSIADPSFQMEAVHLSAFERVRLLNREEARYLPAFERTVTKIGQGHRVMAQTSLGELIRPVSQGTNDRVAQNAFSSINSKRLDFAIIDRTGLLVCAVEYQGSGHYQGRAFIRDAVKKEALRKAGVPVMEVTQEETPDAAASRLAAVLAKAPDDTRKYGVA